MNSNRKTIAVAFAAATITLIAAATLAAETTPRGFVQPGGVEPKLGTPTPKGPTPTVAPSYATAGTPLPPDFAFRVPVQLRELHRSVREAKVHCAVGVSRNALGQSVGVPIAEGSAPIPLDANRSFSGLVMVAVHAPRNANLENVNTYACHLVFNGTGYAAGSDAPMWRSSPGTPRRLEVTGPVVR